MIGETAQIAIGLSVPLAGTVLGAAPALFMRRSMGPRLQKAFLGFAAGVMIAASVWSLLIPSMEMSGDNGSPWLPASAGFLAGAGFLLVLDSYVPHLHVGSGRPEGRGTARKESTMLTLAVTLHNIPEGMAIGVVFAGVLAGGTGVTVAGAYALALGMAIQNFPEGAVVSVPLADKGLPRGRAFAYGVASGLVEPAAAAAVMLLACVFVPVLPFLLAFAAGAMMYVVVEELIPGSQSGEHSDIGTVAAAAGFVLMMVLDVALG